MALILREAYKLYHYLNDEISDSRTQNWFLMRTPWPGLALLVLYLCLVLRWLPARMRNKTPLELRTLIATYNTVQIVACFYLVFQSLRLGWVRHYSFICQPVDYSTDGVEYAWKVCYGYFVVKLIDLLDTIFFVLRKKQNQVSFLHVYHHAGMVMLSWGMVKWLPGGHCSLLVPINSLVHMVMYTYYLLTVWDDAYKRCMWWKKHVTQLQIIQFTVLLVHFIALATARECSYPRLPAYILIPQNLFMVILFCDFYYRAYIKKSNIKS